MSAEITPWPKSGHAAEPPKRVMRPCDYGLLSAWYALESQLGTIEAHNRLCAFAERTKALIDAGKVKAQNPLYATSPQFAKE